MSLAARFHRLATPSLADARSLAGVFALAITLVGCAGEATDSDSASLVATDDGGRGSAPGWLVLDWSIAGDKRAEQCDSSHSATVAVTVATESGEVQGVHQATCMAFNATIQLAPGAYSAQAALLDGAGADLTVPVALLPFAISSGIPVRVPLEFPASLFGPH